MRKTIMDNYKTAYRYEIKASKIRKRKATSPMNILEKFNTRIIERTYMENGQVRVTFDDNSRCTISTYYNTIKPLASNHDAWADHYK